MIKETGTEGVQIDKLARPDIDYQNLLQWTRNFRDSEGGVAFANTSRRNPVDTV